MPWLQYKDFSGGKVHRSRYSQAVIPPNAAEDCQDCVPLPGGALSKRPGRKVVNTTDFGTSRLYAAGMSANPNRVQFCDLAAPGTKWNTDCSQTAPAHGGYFDLDAPITAMAAQGRALYMFTENSIYRMSNLPPQHYVTQVSNNVGCIGRFTAVECGEQTLCFLAKDGVRAIRSHNLVPTPLTDAVEPNIRGVLPDTDATFKVPVACYDPVRNAYLLSYSASGVNDTTLLIDLKNGSCWPLTIAPRCWLSQNANELSDLATDPGMVYCGGGTGKEYVFCFPSAAKSGTAGDDKYASGSGWTQDPITNYWTSHLTDAKRPDRRKQITRCQMMNSGVGTDGGSPTAAATTTASLFTTDEWDDASPDELAAPSFTIGAAREEWAGNAGDYLFQWKWQDAGAAVVTLYSMNLEYEVPRGG